MLARLHLLTDEARSKANVSTRSQWPDEKWHLNIDKNGLPESAGTFNWNFEMGSAGSLLDPRWSNLLEQCRKLVWSLLTDARSGQTLDPVTIAGSFRQQLGKLLRWMATNNYEFFSELDTEASWEYHDHLLIALRREKDDQVASGRFQFELQVLYTIFRQSSALSDAGVEPMPEAPYDGASPTSVAKASANTANGWIEPLPDDVALRVLAECVRWMGQPMDDVIALRDRFLNADLSKKAGKTRPVKRVVGGFTFSTLPGEKQPWHEQLGIEKLTLSESESESESEKRLTRIDSELRLLVMHASAACVTLIQGTTGMRLSEVTSLRAGVDAQTGLPKYVSIQLSKTGLNELFFLESQVTKIHDGMMMRWVLGMRPAGSTYLPPAITALLRLEQLFKPWRDGSGLPWLILNPAGKSALGRKAENSKPPTRNNIAKRMKGFVAHYGGLASLPDIQKTPSGTVDLRPYKTGEGFRTHQWRKTFALYVLRTDPKMLPAISQHFKHMSLAMTEQGYIGNDPELLDSIDSVRRQRTVQFLLQQASGNAVIAGGMADLVRDHREQLQAVVGDCEGQEAYDRMEAWVAEGDLRIWYAEHGKCFMSLAPADARCHSLGKTDPWFKREPNYAQRNPSVCGGCKCFAVDGEHVVFWQERYRKNSDVLAKAGKDYGGEYRVAHERVRQSAAILRTLSASLDNNEGKE
jgi:integrase